MQKYKRSKEKGETSGLLLYRLPENHLPLHVIFLCPIVHGGLKLTSAMHPPPPAGLQSNWLLNSQLPCPKTTGGAAGVEVAAGVVIVDVVVISTTSLDQSESSLLGRS